MSERVNVRNIMTASVITVKQDDKLGDIITILSENNISGAPVVDVDGKLMGMVSDGDIIRFLSSFDPATGKACKIPESESYKVCVPKFGIYSLEPARAKDLFDIFEHAGKKIAKDVMTAPAISASADDDVETVSSLMMTNGIKRVPVLDSGRLVGIVSRADIVRYVARRKHAKELVG